MTKKKNQTIAHSANTLKICTQNIEHKGHFQYACDRIFHIFNRIKFLDILLIQELRLASEEALTHFRFHLSGRGLQLIIPYYGCLSAIVIQKSILNKKITILSNNSISIGSDTDSRTCDVDFMIEGHSSPYTLINMYLEPGQAGPQTQMITKIKNYIRSHHNFTQLLVGGDFNHVLNPDLDAFKPHSSWLREVQIRVAFTEFSSVFSLLDCFRHLHPNEIRFTNNVRNGLSPRRLDRIHINSHLLPNLLSCDIQTIINNSTHDSVSLTLLLSTHPQIVFGTSRKNFPAYILSDPFVLESILLIRHLPLCNPSIEWDMLLKEIDERVHILHRYLVHAFPRSAKPKPDPSKRFMKPVTDSIITCLTNAQRETATTTPTILNLAYNFFAKLNRPPKNIDLSEQDFFLLDLPFRLTTTQKNDLETPFDVKQLESTLKLVNFKSAPGDDGINFQVLRDLWPIVGKPLTEVGNHLMSGGKLPNSMKYVNIILLHKKKRSDAIENKRPISLISTGLRLLSLHINRCLNKVSDTLIGRDQAGFIPTRDINENIFNLRAITDHIRKHNDTRSYDEYTSLVSIDFHKAFDSIHHPFILKTLKQANFGPRIIKFLMAVTTQQYGQLFINGFKSRSFPLTMGTRQGNPVSPFLFNLVLETFLVRVHFSLTHFILDHNLCAERHFTYAAYADDVIIYTHTFFDQFSLLMLLGEFERASSLRVNPNKTIVYSLTNQSPPDYLRHLPYPVQPFDPDKFKYLGIPFALSDYDNSLSSPWGKHIGFLQAKIRSTPVDDIPIAQAVQLYGSFIFSTLYFKDIHSPLPYQLISSLEDTICNKFRFNLPPSILCKPLSLGGFGMINIHNQLEGKRAEQIFKLLHTSDNFEFNAIKIALQKTLDRTLRGTIDLYCTPSPGRPLRHFHYPWYNFIYGMENLVVDLYRDTLRRLPAPARSWLQAWFRLFSTVHFSSYHLAIYISPAELSQLYLPRRSQDTISFMWEKGPKSRPLDPATSFHSISKKLVDKTPVIPSWPSRLSNFRSPSYRDWSTFWSKLASFQKGCPGALQPYHLFILGRLHYPHFISQPNPGNCFLCGQVPDSMVHVIFECPVTLHIWNSYSLPLRSFSFVIANPLIDRSSAYKINEYIDGVLSLRFRRRTSLARRQQMDTPALEEWILANCTLR